jgi:putative oxidoreductase
MKFSEIKNDLGLLIIRLTFGLSMMLSHGKGKLERLLQGEETIKFYDFMGMGAETSLVLVVFAELLCALMLSLGVFTRLVAVPLVFTMFMAFFIVHAGDPFAKREMSFLFMMAFFDILITGPGRFSVDRLLSKRKN